MLQNLTYENLTMTAVKVPIYIIDWYPERDAPKDPATEKAQPVTARTPINKNITIRNVTAINCPTAGIIRGLPEAPISNVTLSNVTISAKAGMKVYHAKGIRFIDSKIKVESGKRADDFRRRGHGPRMMVLVAICNCGVLEAVRRCGSANRAHAHVLLHGDACARP